MNFLEAVVEASPRNLAEAGSGARRETARERAAATRWLSMVLKVRAASRTTVRGAKKKGPEQATQPFHGDLDRVQSIVGTTVGKQTL